MIGKKKLIIILTNQRSGSTRLILDLYHGLPKGTRVYEELFLAKPAQASKSQYPDFEGVLPSVRYFESKMALHEYLDFIMGGSDVLLFKVMLDQFWIIESKLDKLQSIFDVCFIYLRRGMMKCALSSAAAKFSGAPHNFSSGRLVESKRPVGYFWYVLVPHYFFKNLFFRLRYFRLIRSCFLIDFRFHNLNVIFLHSLLNRYSSGAK